jgi:tetratricopeptide (TPR) repeat protein
VVEHPDGAASGDESTVDETVTGTATAETVATRAMAGPMRVEIPPLSRGENVGRYVIVDIIGRGGMGIVYKAYDPDLDRRIALKLLRPRVTDAESHTSGRDRLLREAQALAQLSHPNVVAVYDVGTVDDDVFVAMELVEGATLRTWIGDDRPPLRQVVSAFAAAGEGLVAAHEAGLVHRDFKPENVMLGDDHRVRVLDFGLARPEEEDEREQRVPRSGASSSGSGTQADVMVGTPPYMAPEQYRRERANELTDQYSFCISMFEVLYGARPYKGRRYKQLKTAVLAGEVVVPDGAAVPARIARVIRRGMSPDVGDRYPSMRALLDDLYRAPAVTRRRVLAGAGVAALAALAIAGLARGGSASAAERCEALRGELDGVWNAAVSNKMKLAFTGTQRPYAEHAAATTTAALDDYRQQWSAMRVEACRATHVRGVQSDELLDLRMTCLDQRRDALGALVSLLVDAPESDVVERSVDAAGALPEIAHCADADALRAGYQPPKDAAERRRVAAIRRELSHVEALLSIGRYTAAVPPAVAAEQHSQQLVYPPLAAEAVALLAHVQDAAGNLEEAELAYDRALRAAAATNNRSLLSTVWLRYADFVGTSLERYDGGLAYAKAAEISLATSGARPRQQAWLLSLVGSIQESKGELEKARATLESALVLQEKTAGVDSTDVGATLDRLATTLKMLGEYGAARAHQQRAIEIFAQRLGPDHPKVAALIYNLGLTELASGNCTKALEHYAHSQRLLEASLGAHHPNLAVVLSESANCMRQKGDYDRAMKTQQRALAIRERAYGPDHLSLAFSLQYLGDLLVSMKRYDEARPHLERALSIRESALDAKHPQVGESVAAIGELLWAQDRPAEARPYYERTRDIYEVAYGKRHPFYAVMLLNLGDIDLELGQPARAVPNLENAVIALRASESAGPRVADAEFVLARALWKSRQDRKRAREIARRARAAFAEVGDDHASQVATIDAWLKSH